jgi:EAL domain-containing protein (putative c-di-GMP-specific phosphodiesterase class I)
MYEAKHQGRGRYAFYAEHLGKKIRQRLQLHQDLQHALERQEFVLHYQPLVDISQHRIIGAEALIRWQDPLRGLRGPGEFIPYAEESGLILPIGEWVLRTACQQAKRWAEQGLAVHMAVNLSTRQFQDPALVPKVQDVLAEMELDSGRLSLEITESAAMLNPEASLSILGDLKALGVAIAIDDFGTGYSSLSYLKRIPADIIKIDQSFVKGLNIDPDDTAIVRTVLALANMMEKRCLAEGIETRGQFDTLREMDCHYGQGYLFSRPLPADAFEQLLRSGKIYCDEDA